MDRGAWWATVHGVTKTWTQRVPEHAHTALSRSALLCSRRQNSTHLEDCFIFPI